MKVLPVFFDLLLAGLLIWDAIQFGPQYRRTGKALAEGDQRARLRLYYRLLSFEWLSALLALTALQFDWNKLNAKSLNLDYLLPAQRFATGNDFFHGIILGILGAAVVVGLVAGIVLKLKANRRSENHSVPAPESQRKSGLPDFSVLIPVTRTERWWFALAAVSAGVCEEVVYRGWLLATLKGRFGIGGVTLLAIASLIFGLAHMYQKIPGVIQTTILGGFFCGLYVTTGSLVAPIVVHALIDLQWVFRPAPESQALQAPQG